MVFYFTSNVVSPPYIIYMGADKHENEELIKWGWPEDVWFHVDKLSSAHVYLRLHKGDTIDDVPEAVVQDCVQLVKANSIEGCKKNDIDVVYTMWANLNKTANMDVGQVGFHNQREVRKVHVERKINELVNRLNKTKQERKVDLRAEREQRDREERDDQKAKLRDQKRADKVEQERKAKEADERSYSSLMQADKMVTNRETVSEDDFM